MITRKLRRNKDTREMLFRNLSTSLILYEKIVTTKSKAKSLKSVMDKYISLAKKNDLASRRIIKAYLVDKNAVKKVFEVLAPRYNKRNSGYTKLYHMANRLGDGTEMVMIRLIEDKVIKNDNKLDNDEAKKEK